jgi:hypothetical protein
MSYTFDGHKLSISAKNVEQAVSLFTPAGYSN